jgi:hypothetical protein
MLPDINARRRLLEQLALQRLQGSGPELSPGRPIAGLPTGPLPGLGAEPLGPTPGKPNLGVGGPGEYFPAGPPQPGYAPTGQPIMPHPLPGRPNLGGPPRPVHPPPRGIPPKSYPHAGPGPEIQSHPTHPLPVGVGPGVSGTGYGQGHGSTGPQPHDLPTPPHPDGVAQQRRKRSNSRGF